MRSCVRAMSLALPSAMSLSCVRVAVTDISLSALSSRRAVAVMRSPVFAGLRKLVCMLRIIATVPLLVCEVFHHLV